MPGRVKETKQFIKLLMMLRHFENRDRYCDSPLPFGSNNKRELHSGGRHFEKWTLLFETFFRTLHDTCMAGVSYEWSFWGYMSNCPSYDPMIKKGVTRS